MFIGHFSAMGDSCDEYLVGGRNAGRLNCAKDLLEQVVGVA